MSFNHYYQSELTALRQLGRRFAERSPALAPFLGQAGRDPDVERLLEGFAFLTGRLRQKLDDELPELSHSLMHLLWPNYMRPLPAFSILQFDPLKRSGPALMVERDTPVESVPIEDVRCRFRTCYPTEVLPLDLAALNYSAKGDGSLLSLRLEMSADGHLGELELSRLRLHFAGERYISQMLYLSLLRNLKGIELVPLDGAGKPINGVNGTPMAFKMPGDRVQPVGFAEEEALIPYPLNTFRGYRYLQEYFAFQDKLLFVDINGLDLLKALPEDTLKQVRGLELRFDIRKSGIQRLRPTLDNVKLYCTPIVNLFKHDALLSLRAHSAALIEAVLRYYFKHAELTIEQCIERRVEILDEQRNRLGRANSLLGQDLVLGEHVRDRSGKFRIHSEEGVRLFDFGLGQAEEGILPGLPHLSRNRFNAWTPGYAAPELLEGQPLSASADVYGVACVLYELAGGKHPFRRLPSTVARDGHLERELHAPRNLPRHCWPALRTALAFDAADRTITAAQLRDAMGATSSLLQRLKLRA